jgi:hypothetical protein
MRQPPTLLVMPIPMLVENATVVATDTLNWSTLG